MASIAIDRLDGLSSSAAIKGPVKAATTANITLYAEQTIDGVALVDGDRVLVKDQTAAYENGIYVVDTGQWRRSKDFNRNRDVVEGTMVYVTDGTVNAGTIWSVSSDDNNVGTSNTTIQLIFAGVARDTPHFSSRSAAESAVIPSAVSAMSVQQGDLLLFFKRDASGTALTTAGGVTWSPLGDVYPDHFAENVTPGTTDMTAAGQAAIDWSAANDADGYFAQTIYGITGWVWKEGASFTGAGNWSGQTFVNPTLGTTVIRYIGAGGANSCVIRFSKLDVGVEGNAATGNMSNMRCTNITIDGNELAEFGGYWNRSWSNSQWDYITASNTLKHGLWAGNCWGGSPTNWLGYKNLGCGITLGINTFGWAQCVIDQSVATSFFGYYSGYAIDESGSADPVRSAFSDATPDLEYGIGVGSHRAFVMINPQANECSGAGIYRGDASYSPLTIIGGYVENNGRSINATRRWDLWYKSSAAALNDTIQGMHFGVATTGAIKITGSPNTSRPEALLKITGCPILPTIDADHGYYRLIDCDRDPQAIVGSSPMYFLARIGDAMNLIPIGMVLFYVNAGAIVEMRKEGAITSVTYNATGDYTLTLSVAQNDSTWIAQGSAAGDNRYVRTADYTATTCRIYHKSLTNVAADPTGTTLAIRVVVFGNRA